MQINRRSSRWPFVAAMVCLLVLCLTIPIYWQSSGLQAKKQTTGIKPGSRRVAVAWPTQDELDRMDGFEPVADATAAEPGTAQTLDQLLAGLSNPRAIVKQSPRTATVQAPDAFDELFLPPAEISESAEAEPEFFVPGPYVTAVLRWAGREMAQLSPGQLAGPVFRIANVVGRTIDIAQDSTPLSIHLHNPNDRLALLPPQRQSANYAESPTTESSPAPAADVAEFATPWCTPVALIDRLQVLAEYPYAADWARQTIDELRPLTDNYQLNSDDVSARLARLADLSAKAVQLAAAARDEPMCAELLRAHWALARRLECWTLMRDITVATAAANRFAARVPWDSSASSLSGQGTELVDLYSLSDDLESYERTRTPRLARAIVERQRQLSQSADAQERELANRIEQNYRNSNVRVALSAELLNRYVPAAEPEDRAVRDRIAGTPVRGRSQTVAENRLRLEPDTGVWRLGLQSDGTVESHTVADGGQAKLLSHGTTEFAAQKAIVVDPNGVQVGPTSADAHTHNQLLGVHTNFDWIPLVGDLARSQAVDEYHKKQPRARAEVEYKVARRVEQQMDSRADAAVDRVQQQVRDRFTRPIENAGIEVKPIELTTTSQRLVARMLVAGSDQLGGHTPRPRAPADSLASLQVHESAFTNAALALKLDGQRYTAPELQKMLREKITRLQQRQPLDVKEDTVFQFADQDAVRFRVANQHLEVILSMADVEFEGQKVRDFRVHGFYRPEINGLEAEFVRDGALGIEGKIRTGDRARMHGVFNKVLSEDRRLSILDLTDPNDPRLSGLMITQFVLEDGWIGVAVGPSISGRTAELSRMLR